MRNWTVTAGATIVADCFAFRWRRKLLIRHPQVLHLRAIVPARFDGHGRVHCARELPGFFWSAHPAIGIHGNKNAVVFMEIMADGIFDHTGVWKSSDEINQHNACAFGFARLCSQFSNVCMFLRR